MPKRLQKLTVRNLSISVDGQPIVHDVSFSVGSGEIVVLLGPNGSGKSSLAYALAGHPRYVISEGTMTIGRKDLLRLKPEGRARAGLFLAMQSPPAIAGVGLGNFLRLAKDATVGARVPRVQFREQLLDNLRNLHLAESFAERELHEGFSGGEKKRSALLELAILEPKFAILDEIDSGLDVDGLKIAAQKINDAAQRGTGFLLIMHGTRLLSYIKPDRVLVLSHGTIVEQGKAVIAERIERQGFTPISQSSP